MLSKILYDQDKNYSTKSTKSFEDSPQADSELNETNNAELFAKNSK